MKIWRADTKRSTRTPQPACTRGGAWTRSPKPLVHARLFIATGFLSQVARPRHSVTASVRCLRIANHMHRGRACGPSSLPLKSSSDENLASRHQAVDMNTPTKRARKEGTIV
jgi:hypothetical protein